MAYTQIDQIDYRSGFEVGFRAIRGRAPTLPALPAQPTSRDMNMTPFLMGVRKGLQSAGIDLHRQQD